MSESRNLPADADPEFVALADRIYADMVAKVGTGNIPPQTHLMLVATSNRVLQVNVGGLTNFYLWGDRLPWVLNPDKMPEDYPTTRALALRAELLDIMAEHVGGLPADQASTLVCKVCLLAESVYNYVRFMPGWEGVVVLGASDRQ
jgi:hypothetical protein